MMTAVGLLRQQSRSECLGFGVAAGLQVLDDAAALGIQASHLEGEAEHHLGLKARRMPGHHIAQHADGDLVFLPAQMNESLAYRRAFRLGRTASSPSKIVRACSCRPQPAAMRPTSMRVLAACEGMSKVIALDFLR
jgi:hypothetical protein